jgi:hypothetical protein
MLILGVGTWHIVLTSLNGSGGLVIVVWQTGLHLMLLMALIVSLLATRSRIIVFSLHLFTVQLLAETCCLQFNCLLKHAWLINELFTVRVFLRLLYKLIAC